MRTLVQENLVANSYSLKSGCMALIKQRYARYKGAVPLVTARVAPTACAKR
jgi:hypothetical protein